MNQLSIKQKAIIANLAMILLIGASFFVLGLNQLWSKGPFGIHFIRQTDSLSFVQQFANNGFDFLHPQLFNLDNPESRAACEFPVIYYLTAFLYKFFGSDYLYLKLINLIILYSGVFYLFRTINLLLKNRMLSILIALIPFSSTIFNYYSFNYLPDSAALGFSFIGYYFMFLFIESKRRTDLLKSTILFTFAGLLKPIFFIHPLVFFTLALFALFTSKISFFSRDQSIKVLSYLLIGIAVIVIWNVYVFHYNELYNTTYFNTRAMPIWDLNSNHINKVFDIMFNYWRTEYFSILSIILIAGALIFQFIFGWKHNRNFTIFTSVLFMGSLSYFILFFKQFENHDYYFLCLIPLFIFSILNTIQIILKYKRKSKIITYILSFGLLVAVVHGLKYSRHQIHNRINIAPSQFDDLTLQVRSAHLDLDKLGIPKTAKILVVDDGSLNGVFLELNLMGWILNSSGLNPDMLSIYRQNGATVVLGEMKVYDQFSGRDLYVDDNIFIKEF